MALKFEITGDNRNFLDSLDGARNGVRRVAQDIESSGMSIEDMFKRIAAAAGIAFTLDQAKGFVNQVMTVRGQFQQLEIAFSTMLQSEEKAKELMDQLVETAAKTPFDLKGVSEGAKQLLAYGIQAEDVNETITRLGDIAAGLSIPLGDLVYLYGTTMTQGRMFTMDLRQFMGRGIPMAEELAKQFGVAKEEVAGLVTAGRVSAEAVKNAIWGMTEEGTKFGGLMAKQSASITGQISNIQDAIDNMFNDIGQQNEGLINLGLEGVSYLVEHYEAVGKILLQLVAIYGSYKAAVMAYVAIQKVHATWIALEQTAHLQNALATEAEIAAKGKATVATVVLDKATKALNATMLTNPYVMVAAGIMTLVSAIYLFGNRTDEVAEAQEKLYETTKDLKSEIASERANIDSLFDKLRNAKEGTDEYKKTKDQILGQYGKYLKGLSDEISTLKDVEGAYKAVTKAAREASVARGKEAALKDVQDTYGKNYANNIEKLQSALNSRVGGKQAADALAKIQNELQKTGTISAKTEQQVREMFRGTADYGNSGAWLTGLKNNEKYLNDYTKLVEQRFQSEDETGKKANEAKKKRNKQAIEEERKNLQGQLEALDRSEAIGKKGAELKKKIAGLDNELKAYNTSGKSGSKTANYAANRRQKEFELDLKQTEDQAAQAQNTRNAIEQARIASIEDNAVRERATQDEQHRLTLQSIDNREEEMKKALYDYNKSVWDNKNKKKNLKYSDTSEGAAGWEILALTKEQQDELKALRDKENSEYARLIQERYRAEAQAMREYLKEYGTLEQQKLAITQEYEEKVQQATTPTGRAALMLERNQALKDFDAKQFEEKIDWAGIFSDLQGHTQEYLIGLRDQLRGVLNEGNLTPEQMSVVQEKLRDLNDEISKQNGLFQFQGDRAREHTRLVQEAADAQARLTQAKEEEADAQKNVLDVTNQIRDMLEGAGIDRDVDIDDEILSQFDANSEEYKQMSRLLEQLRIGEGNLAKARRGTADATKKAKNAEDAKQRESSQAVADWFADAQQFITEKGIDQIPDLFNELGLGEAGKKVQLGMDAFNSGSQAAADFASGNYIGAALNGFKALKSFGELLGIGGSSDKHLEEDIERLTASNEALKYSIDELAKKMDEGAVADAEAIYKRQSQQLAESERNTREMMSRSGAAYSDGFLGIGGSHSSNANIDDSVSSSEWSRISQLLGKSVRGAGEFFNLTSEQMYRVAVELPDVYAHIKDLADDGFKDAAKFMDEYIDYYKQLQELQDAYTEKLASTSFDSLQDDFANALMDMDSDAKSFAESFEKYMQTAIINSLVSEQYKPLLEKWYKAFGSAMKDGLMSEVEMKRLRETGGTYYDEIAGKWESYQSWDSITESAIAARDALKDMFGWTSEAYQQEASSKGIQGMSQDVGQELNGRFTALQIAGERISEGVSAMLGTLSALSALTEGSNMTLAEIRNLMIMNNAFLEDILAANKEYYKKFHAQLDKIVTQTK